MFWLKSKTGRRRSRFQIALNERLERAAPLLFGSLKLLAFVGVCAAAVWGLQSAEAKRQLAADFQQPVEFVLIDAPEHLQATILDDLSDLASRPWIDEALCARLHERLTQSGWIKRVNRIGKSSPGVVYVDCEYREPLAMLQHHEHYYLVDEFGVRLPGRYEYDPDWILIQGVSAAPPEEGQEWPGDDLSAGIKLAHLIMRQPYREQVAAILVHNYGGRYNAYDAHIELVSDHHAARILWGSAPGEELEENTAAQKLHILAENHRRYGRIDANESKIDISVFADRFIIPAR